MTDQEREQEIRAAMGELARAFLERDTAALQELLDDDFTGADPAGLILSKEQWIDDLATGKLVFHSIESDGIEFQHLPDGVRVRGQLTFRADYARSNWNGSFRYLGLYARRGERWRLMLSTARRVLP